MFTKKLLSKAQSLLMLLFFLTSSAALFAAEKRIIAHEMVSMSSDLSLPDRPLDTWRQRYQVAAQLGVNELTMFMESGNSVDMDKYIASAKYAATIPGFSISMCICLPRCKLDKGWLETIKKWCDAAAHNPGFANVDGRPVIWTYHAGAFPLAEWKAFMDKLHAQGYNPYFIADMFAFAANKPREYLKQVDEWAEVMDSLYMFGNNAKPEHIEAMIKATFKARKNKGGSRMIVGTVGNGYWRWGNDKQSQSQLYDGTGKYELNWQRIVDKRDDYDWVHLSTWNDYLEHTMNEPTRNNNGIYGELLKEYGVRFRGGTPTEPTRYWVTAPAELRNGPGGLNEYIYELRATGLNAERAVTGSIVFMDDCGTVIRTEKALLSATSPVFRFSWEPKLNEFGNAKYFIMNATVDESGQALSGSLPIPLWPATESRIMYKTPRSLRLLPPDQIPLAPRINVSSQGEMRVTPLPNADDGSVRVDILYDMYSKGAEGVNLGPVIKGVRQLPEFEPYDPYYFKRGFRQAAIITRDGRVAWAKPIWIDHDLPPIRKEVPPFDLKKITDRPFFPVKINFQPAGTKIPAGYIADTGRPFGHRGNGRYYGWSRDVTAFTRERHMSDDPVYDTMIPLQYYLSRWDWSMALPDGLYHIKLGMGDSAFKNTSAIRVNGIRLSDPTPGLVGSDDYEVTTTVTGNLLKITAEPGDDGRLNYLEISPATAP